MAIRFRGALEDFSLLEYGHCPPAAVQLEEGEKLEEIIRQSLRQSVPLLILLDVLMIARFIKGLNKNSSFSLLEAIFVLLLWVLCYFLLIVLHELIHAVFFPRRAAKDVWLYKRQAALVYCNTPIKRGRFIVMSLAPATLLGILPFALWLIRADAPSPIVSLAWCAMAWAMIFGGIGDFYNVRNVIRQVPKGAYVFNYGIHTYWIKDPRAK